MRILVAEDDPTMRALLQTLLRKAGYEVKGAVNGEEALAELGKSVSEESGEEPYDLLISDWSMPKCSGLELIQRTRAIEKLNQLFIIMVTAKADVDQLVSGLDAGADEYITKPFQPLELLARVKAGLRIRKLQSENARLQHQLAAAHIATTASHEINNPLMVLLGNWEMMKQQIQKLGDPALEKRLNAIGNAANRIQRVVECLRDLKDIKLKKYVKKVDMIDLELENQTAAPSPNRAPQLPGNTPNEQPFVFLP